MRLEAFLRLPRVSMEQANVEYKLVDIVQFLMHSNGKLQAVCIEADGSISIQQTEHLRVSNLESPNPDTPPLKEWLNLLK